MHYSGITIIYISNTAKNNYCLKMSLKFLFSFTMTLNFMKVWKYIWEPQIKHCFASFQEGFQQEYTKKQSYMCCQNQSHHFSWTTTILFGRYGVNCRVNCVIYYKYQIKHITLSDTKWSNKLLHQRRVFYIIILHRLSAPFIKVFM